MPRARPKKHPPAPSAQPEALLQNALRQLAPSETELKLQIAAEFACEALGEGIAVDTASFAGRAPGNAEGIDCVELEELLAEALASVDLSGGTKALRAAAAEALLESGVLRFPQEGQGRLRLEASAAADDAAAMAALFSLRVGVIGRAHLALDDDWHDVVINQVLDNDRLTVALGDGEAGAGAAFEVDKARFQAEWELQDEDDTVAGCELCEREMPLTFHHLIPKQEAPKYKTRLSKAELVRGVHVCRPCHSAIHRTFTNQQLAASRRTIDSLLDEKDEATLPLRRWRVFAASQHVSRSPEAQLRSARCGGAGLPYSK